MSGCEFHPEELRGGAAPSDFEIINGVCSPSIAIEKGFHPDDQCREEWLKIRDEEK